ncbi:MAG: hypothetical protein OEZ01_04330 [Candidatus Heimdallarchaeota archaeon]|nr:hypothetical protein [Candidatus Heimdallarchaeota archaeon]
MTKEEHQKISAMFSGEFQKIKNPTLEQCLVWLRSYDKNKRLEFVHAIPKKHRKFCVLQLKLENNND